MVQDRTKIKIRIESLGSPHHLRCLIENRKERKKRLRKCFIQSNNLSCALATYMYARVYECFWISLALPLFQISITSVASTLAQMSQMEPLLPATLNRVVPHPGNPY